MGVLPSSSWRGPRKESPFFPTSRMMEVSLAFLQSPPLTLPMPTCLPALQCPHTPPQTTPHVLLLFLQLPILLPSLLCSCHLPCSQFPFWILLLPPQFTAFITQCSPEAIHPFSEFYCCCRTPKAGSSLYCRIQLLSRILTVAVHSSASAPFSAVQYFLSWQRSPMPPPKEG